MPKVKVIRCTGEWWYMDRVGKTYDVVESHIAGRYEITTPGDDLDAWLFKNDCIVLETEDTPSPNLVTTDIGGFKVTHADILGGMVILPEGNFKIVDNKLVACDENWDPIISEGKKTEQVPSWLRTEEEMVLNTSVENKYEIKARKLIVKFQNESKISDHYTEDELIEMLTILPSLSEVKQFIEENEELIGFDQNAKLFAINLYLWIKSR